MSKAEMDKLVKFQNNFNRIPKMIPSMAKAKQEWEQK